MSNIISYPGIQILEADDLMLITDVSKDDKPLRSVSIGRLAAYIEGGGGTSTSINGESGSITFVAGDNVTIDKVGKTFTINSTGGSGGGGVGGSGTPGYLSMWKTSDTLGDTMMYDDGVGISIGATSNIVGSQFRTLDTVTATGTRVNTFFEIATSPTAPATGPAYATVVKISSNSAFREDGLIGINPSVTFSGSDGAFYLYGDLTTSSHIGAGHVDFVSGSSVRAKVGGTSVATTEYLRGVSVLSTVDNATATVDYLQGTHTSAVLKDGTVGEVNVGLLDFDYTAGTITGDFSYLRIQSDNVPSVGGTARGIHSLTTLPSEFAGSIGAASFIKKGGTSSEYLMADGSVTTGTGISNPLGYYSTGTLEDGIVVSIGDLNEEGNGTYLTVDDNTGGVVRTNLGTTIQAGRFDLYDGTYESSIDKQVLTGNRTLYVPDASGTIALTSDIPSAGADIDEIAFFVQWTSANTTDVIFTPLANWDISGMQWQWNYDNSTGRYLLECKSEDWFNFNHRITMSANLNAFSNGKLIQIEMMRVSASTILVEAFQVDATGVQRHDLIDSDMRASDVTGLGSFPQGLDIRIKRWPFAI